MKSTRKYSLILFWLLLSVSLAAQSAGTTSFEFLKTQYSPRGAAMANNLVAIRGDVGAMFYNPAVLSGIDDKQWTINYVDHLLDFQGGQLAYSQKNDRFGTLGVGLLYFSYGNFEETNEFGEITGRNFNASEFALAASVSNKLGEGFDYGVNLKFIYSSLDEFNASAIAIDGGIIYTPSYINDLWVGLSLSNVGFILDEYTTAKEKMPLFLRFGIAKRLEHLPLLFTASLNDLTLRTEKNSDFIKRFSIGGEFDVSEIVKFRLGYDNGINQSVKSLGGRNFGGVSAGLGIIWKKFRLDYAYSNFGDLGSQNRLGISGSL